MSPKCATQYCHETWNVCNKNLHANQRTRNNDERNDSLATRAYSFFFLCQENDLAMPIEHRLPFYKIAKNQLLCNIMN